MKKIDVCILFGGVSPEHEVSLRSAESVLNNIDRTKYHVIPVGITKDGAWYYFGGSCTADLPGQKWLSCPDNLPAVLSPARGQGLLLFSQGGVRIQHLDVVFPVLHGSNGEDGAIQGLLQLAGIPCVGPGIASSAMAMDKSLTKIVADAAGIAQADWKLVCADALGKSMAAQLSALEAHFQYPVFVKPASTGSSVGVSKAADREELRSALEHAAKYDSKILVEECIIGREVEVAVLGNDIPAVSVCGEIDSGAEFYDYDAKYVADTSVAYIPARLDADVSEAVRAAALRVYAAMGCKGLSRVDFFVTADNRVILNEINTLPGFTSISMYPKLFAATGISYSSLIDELLRLAMEA